MVASTCVYLMLVCVSILFEMLNFILYPYLKKFDRLNKA